MEDVDLARLAISKMRLEHIYEPGSTQYGALPLCQEDEDESGVLWNNLARIRPEWHLPFLRLLTPYTDHVRNVGRHGLDYIVHILDIDPLTNNSEGFKPVPYQSRRARKMESKKRRRSENEGASAENE